MNVVTIVGARPQFVKAAVVSKALRELPDVEETIVHTGQHYDPRMSQVFFDELGIPPPAYNLEVGSGRHGRQTGLMLGGIEEVLLRVAPQAVLVYGDTNSTVAGALAAAKLHVPVAHVEAGLRSFNRHMPEEVNRVLTDHLSSLLLCPTEQAVEWLAAEGITNDVHLVGDVMYDAACYFAAAAVTSTDLLGDFGLRQRQYVLMTCHRAENTDDPARMTQIMDGAAALAGDLPVVFPVHPRTRKLLQQIGWREQPGLTLTEPASYLQMLSLERQAAAILTDSGGVQKEAFFFGIPCVTVRDETEWVETVTAGANVLVKADAGQIAAAVRRQLARTEPLPDAGPYYGENRAAERVARLVMQFGCQRAAA